MFGLLPNQHGIPKVKKGYTACRKSCSTNILNRCIFGKPFRLPGRLTDGYWPSPNRRVH